MAYSCFSLLMKRMVANFPHGGAMDQHFASLRYMLQVLDPELFEMMQSNGDYTHFYFCYRWLLLDFKRGQFIADKLSVPIRMRETQFLNYIKPTNLNHDDLNQFANSISIQQSSPMKMYFVSGRLSGLLVIYQPTISFYLLHWQ